jgi:cell division initiation protein
VREDIEITPLDIQQHQFNVRFRGFDIQEVDEFLEQIAHTMEALYDENDRLNEEILVLKQERNGVAARENDLRRSATDSEKIIEQMNDTARKSADLIIADAGVKAERILNRAESRLSQLYEDIIQLKGQRIQLEAQLYSIIEAHQKLLEMAKAQMKMRDDEHDKERLNKQSDPPPQ